MIVYCAILPHAPLLIPGVGKEKLETFAPTTAALEVVARELYAAKPDVVVMLTPHGPGLPDAFTLNISQQMESAFDEFGDFETKRSYASSPFLAMELKERIMYDMPLQLVTEERLDHGTATPLLYIADKLTAQVMPITCSLMTLREHTTFGELLKRELAKSDRRIAVIASGNLAHCLTKQAPLPYSPEGSKFDEAMRSIAAARDTEALGGIQPQRLKKTGADLVRPLAILLGILKESNCTYEELVYQETFGVGYLTGVYRMK